MLNYDYSVWSELNKELLIRAWIYTYRNVLIEDGAELSNFEGYEIEYGTPSERLIAIEEIKRQVKLGTVNPITYHRIKRFKGF